MTRHSLRLRLALAQAASLGVALLVAGLGLMALFERHLERRVDEELATYVRQLAGQLQLAADGTPSLTAALAEPRFDVPLSGLYWQIAVEPAGQSLRSRSLWDQVIALPADAPAPGDRHSHVLVGPAGATLLVYERLIVVDSAAGEQAVRLAAAIDLAALETALGEYRNQLAIALLGLAIVLALAGWLQLWFGLKPVEAVRRAVTAVREGQSDRLLGRYPDEIQPLAAEVNALLDGQANLIDGARARAADLAHGLKTPLTVLDAEARRIAAGGDLETATVLGELARNMRRHVDRELARSRLVGAKGRNIRTPLAPVVERVVATLARTPKGAELDWQVTVPDEAMLALDADDLTELLGSILDNSAKWACTMVRIDARPAAPARLALEIADDGPGVAARDRERLGTRGVRLDASNPGHGIGLAIARDIVLAYGGALAFAQAPSGGLAVQLDLPAAQASIGQASRR